ncbi:MAG TPA: thymidylate synthase, partial [Methanobacterium sp.]|nr:thymidylate synthase [Methanobacterium sp.]
MAFLIEADEIADGWEALVRRIIKEGNEIKDERGSLTKELLNIMVNVRNPLGKNLSGYLSNMARINNIKVPEGYFWSGEKLEIYAEQFLSKDRQGFVYTYGNRLREHFQGI